MAEESTSQILLEELNRRRELAEEYKELKDNKAFQQMFLQGYLGRYEESGKRILAAIGRSEDCDDEIQTFRELHRFKEYLAYLESGERSWLYQDLYKKMEEGTLDANEVISRLGAIKDE